MRTTAAVIVIVGMAIAVGAVSLVIVLHRSLVHNIDDVAEARAQDVATLVQQGSLPSTLGVTGEDAGLTQVVDASGQVQASTAGLDPNRPLATFQPSGTEPEFRTATDLPAAADGPFRVLALAATGPDGPVTIYVATSMEPVDDAIGALRTALIVGSPRAACVSRGHGLGSGRTRPAPGGRDNQPGRCHLRPVAGSARPGAAGRRRDIASCAHREPDARPARGRGEAPATLRRRRVP